MELGGWAPAGAADGDHVRCGSPALAARGSRLAAHRVAAGRALALLQSPCPVTRRSPRKARTAHLECEGSETVEGQSRPFANDEGLVMHSQTSRLSAVPPAPPSGSDFRRPSRAGTRAGGTFSARLERQKPSPDSASTVSTRSTSPNGIDDLGSSPQLAWDSEGSSPDGRGGRSVSPPEHRPLERRERHVRGSGFMRRRERKQKEKLLILPFSAKRDDPRFQHLSETLRVEPEWVTGILASSSSIMRHF